MKNILMAIVVILINIQVFAQVSSETDANVFGHVKCNCNHIPFTTIFIKGTTISTTTDATGHYMLVNLPEGEHIIVTQSIGYMHKEKTINAEKGKTIELNFTIEEDLIGLEEVVVSSDRNGINKKNSSVIVNSINSEVFAITNSVSLAEGLDFTPGLRTECNCQNCGFTQVRMNGLEGPYSQILINSRPVFSGLAGVYGLELFPASMVEKVEVVRGGGSALYGGNAIAGTINIITKEPTTNTFGVSSNISAVGIGHESSDKLSFDKSLNFSGSIISDNLKSGLLIFGMIRNRDPYDDNADGFSEEVFLKSQTIGISTFYKPTIRTKLNLDLYSIHEFRRGGNEFEKLPHETDITEQLEHDIFGVNLGFDVLTSSSNKFSIYGSGQTVNRNSYYGAQQDESAYGKTDDISTSSGFQYSGNFNFITESKIITGFDQSFNVLEDIKLGAAGKENSIIANQAVNTVGSFFQYDLIFKKIKISAGVRYDNYRINDNEEEHKDLIGNVIIPRMNVLFDITDNLQFRTSWAKGYRAPQIFDEDLHIETSGARRITHTNSDDLKQETSDSYSTSFVYNNIFGSNKPVQTEFIVEGFYTILQNPFVNELSAPDEFGNVVYIRKNAESGAYVYGINFETSIAFSKKLITQFGFTQQKSIYEEAQQWGEEEDNVTEYFVRTPDNYGFMTIQYKPVKPLSLSLTGTYTGKMQVPHLGGAISSQEELDELINAGNIDAFNEAVLINEAIENGDIIEGEKLETSDLFFNMGLKVSYDINLKNFYKVRFNLGVQNILDQTQDDHDRGVYRDAGYIYGSHKARSVFFGVEFGTGIK